MAIVGIRDLNRHTKDVIEKLESTREPVILTRQGQPIATILPVDQSRLNDLVISAAPEFAESMQNAEREFEAGETRPLREAMADIRARRTTEDAVTESQAEMSEEGAGEPVPSVSMAVRALWGEYRVAVTDRARQLSDAIVQEATEGKILFYRGVQPEQLEMISQSNTRLYEIGLATEKFRAIDAATSELTKAGAIDESGGSPEEAESFDLDDLASAYVWRVNKSILQRGRQKGGVSIGEYARTLRIVSDKLEDAGGKAPVATTQARQM